MTWRGITAVAFVLVAAGVCVRLGVWQLDRLEERRELNAAILLASEAPPLDVDSAVEALRVEPLRFEHRRATATGRYEGGSDVIVRARGLEGRPGIHLVTLFTTAGGDRLPVLRGWLPAADGARPDTLPPPPGDVRRISGILASLPAEAADPRPTRLGPEWEDRWSVRRLDRDIVERVLGPDIVPVVLQLAGGEPAALPRPVPPPDLSTGPHLSYAVQWFSFALIFLVGGGIVAWRSVRGRDSGRGEAPQDQRGVRAAESERVGHHGLD